MARYRIALVAMLALMAIPMAGFAGSWAMASFDQVPGAFEAGSTYNLHYSILQHGETPVDVADSQVLIIDSAGSITAFDAVPLGQPGRYSVSITFPESGSWDWEVTMGPFASHQMGSIDVREASMESIGPGSLARWMLPVALLLVIGLIVIQVSEVANGRRTTVQGQGQQIRADWSDQTLVERNSRHLPDTVAGVVEFVSIGPNLTQLGDIAGGRVTGMSATVYVTQSIRQPQAFTVDGFGVGVMPTFQISDAEVDALVSFLLRER